MAIKFIPQDMPTLQQAYQIRRREYDVLRSADEWSGAVLHAGFLVELALKIAICKNLDVENLPRTFQVHDLEFLLYCSGLQKAFIRNSALFANFNSIVAKWSTELRYEGQTITKQDSDEIHRALFDSNDGVLVFLSTMI